MENVYLKFVSISHDDHNDVLELEWLATPTSEELKDGLNQALDIVKSKKVTKWIGDVRHMGAIDPTDQEWINTKWFPSLLQAGIKRMGVIVGDDIFNQMSVEDIMSKVESAKFVSQYFSSTSDAKAWVNSTN